MSFSPGSYFSTTEYTKWCITDFLDTCRADLHDDASPPAVDDTSFSSSTDCWVRTLTHFANDSDDLKRAGYASCLLVRYREEGPHGDKAAARRWRTKIGKSGPPEHRAGVQKSKRKPKRSLTPWILNSRNSFTPPLAPASVAGASQDDLGEDASTEYSFATTETSAITETTAGITPDFQVPAPPTHAQQFERMRHKIPCGNGTLESVIYGLLTSTDRDSMCLAPLDLWVLDREMEPQLGDAELAMVKKHIPTLPQFPKHLESYLANYRTVKTLEDCLDVSQASSELFASRTDQDKIWIDKVMYHSFELLLTGYLFLPLGEGSWDSAFHPTFWHNSLFRTPLYSRQKESKMGGNKTIENFRWDGIVCSQKPLGGHQSLAFGLFEVSKQFGVDSPKWKKDWSKLVYGCRAMLSDLKDAVDNDPGTVAELAVVGVLQSGVRTQIIVMSCVGRNLYYMQEGRAREFPMELHNISSVADYIQPIWKSKQIMLACHSAVKRYFEDKEYPI